MSASPARRLLEPVAILAGAALLFGVLWRAGAVLALDVRHEPLRPAFTVLRAVGLVLSAYVGVSVVVGACARATRLPRLVRAIDQVSLPFVRRALRGVATAGLLTALGSSGAPAAHAVAAAPPAAMAPTSVPPPAPPVTMRLLDDEPLPGSTSSPPTLRLLDGTTTTTSAVAPRPPPNPEPPTPVAPDTTSEGSGPPPSSTSPPGPPSEPTVEPASPTSSVPPPVEQAAAPPAATPVESAPPSTWTIAPGDHLWHVAGATLAAAFGVAPSDAETARYLQRLIAENREVLAVPGNADLVFPGQVFRLPPPTT